MAEDEIKYVGVDGCKIGWFSVGMGDGDCFKVKAFISFSDLVNHYSDVKLILVDMPIGLPEGSSTERACEPAARRLLLKPRSSSVFRIPTGEAVHKMAEGMPFEEVKKLEQSLTGGKSITEQARWIMDKIAQVDGVIITRNKDALPKIREIHPELCFWALNNRAAMKNKKQPVKGSEERLEVLRTIECLTDSIYKKAYSKWTRSEVARDDILDALVAAATAKLACTDPKYELRKLPGECPTDYQTAMPPEMVYAVKKADNSCKDSSC